jgi:hypothetical protein
MKSLNLYIQSALDSLSDCTRELNDARRDVAELEAQEQDPPVSSSSIDRVLAHCQKAQRELQFLSKKAR